MIVRMRDLEEQVKRIALENSFLRSRMQEIEEKKFSLKDAISRIQIPVSPEFSINSAEKPSACKGRKRSCQLSRFLR